MLRPLRDQMGIAGGVKNLPWLFTATFVSLLVAQPLYGALVARLPRVRFIPIVYHFFVANLALFWLLLFFDIEPVIVARVFFVWVSVFNLFAVAVFWSFMADLFTTEQGKRLFGFIGAGGTAGALLGPVITIGLSVPLGPVNLLIAAAVFLELAVLCVHRLEHVADPPTERGSSSSAHWRQRVRGVVRTDTLALSAGRGRAGLACSRSARRCLFCAGQHRFGDDPWCGRTNAAVCKYRSRGGPADPGDTGLRHWPRSSSASAPASRPRLCRRSMSRASARWRSRRACRRW